MHNTPALEIKSNPYSLQYNQVVKRKILNSNNNSISHIVPLSKTTTVLELHQQQQQRLKWERYYSCNKSKPPLPNT